MVFCYGNSESRLMLADINSNVVSIFVDITSAFSVICMQAVIFEEADDNDNNIIARARLFVPKVWSLHAELVEIYEAISNKICSLQISVQCLRAK